MRIMEPVLPREMETAIPLEEALAMAAAYEEPVYGYAFAGGSAAGHQLEKTEYKACIFTNCRFTGAALSGAWFQNAVFENCDLSGAKLLEATLQKVRLRGCKLSGANFAAAVLSDVTLEECRGGRCVQRSCVQKRDLPQRQSAERRVLGCKAAQCVPLSGLLPGTGGVFAHQSERTGSDDL